MLVEEIKKKKIPKNWVVKFEFTINELQKLRVHYKCIKWQQFVWLGPPKKFTMSRSKFLIQVLPISGVYYIEFLLYFKTKRKEGDLQMFLKYFLFLGLLLQNKNIYSNIRCYYFYKGTFSVIFIFKFCIWKYKKVFVYERTKTEHRIKYSIMKHEMRNKVKHEI